MVPSKHEWASSMGSMVYRAFEQKQSQKVKQSGPCVCVQFHGPNVHCHSLHQAEDERNLQQNFDINSNVLYQKIFHKQDEDFDIVSASLI